MTFSTVGVDSEGIVDPAEVAAACRPETCLVSVMHCNNEIGSVQPIREISRAVREVSDKIMIHTDAAQSFGKVPVDVEELGVDMATFVGHKIGAPKVRQPPPPSFYLPPTTFSLQPWILMQLARARCLEPQLPPSSARAHTHTHTHISFFLPSTTSFPATIHPWLLMQQARARCLGTHQLCRPPSLLPCVPPCVALHRELRHSTSVKGLSSQTFSTEADRYSRCATFLLALLVA